MVCTCVLPLHHVRTLCLAQDGLQDTATCCYLLSRGNRSIISTRARYPLLSERSHVPSMYFGVLCLFHFFILQFVSAYAWYWPAYVSRQGFTSSLTTFQIPQYSTVLYCLIHLTIMIDNLACHGSVCLTTYSAIRVTRIGMARLVLFQDSPSLTILCQAQYILQHVCQVSLFNHFLITIIYL